MLRRYADPFAARQQTPSALSTFRGHLAATRPLWCSQARTAAASAGLQPRCPHAPQCNTAAQPHSTTAPQPRISAAPQPETRHTAQPQSNTPVDSTEGLASSLRGWFFLTVTFCFASVGLSPLRGRGSRRTPPTRIREGGSPFVVSYRRYACVSAVIRLGMTMFVSSCVLISKRDGRTTSDLMWAGLDGPAH